VSVVARPFLTVDEIADLLRVGRDWVLRALTQGTGGHFIVAGKPRITPEQLIDWLRLLERTPKYGVHGLTVLGRDGLWLLTPDGWFWRPVRNEQNKSDQEAMRRAARDAGMTHISEIIPRVLSDLVGRNEEAEAAKDDDDLDDR